MGNSCGPPQCSLRKLRQAGLSSSPSRANLRPICSNVPSQPACHVVDNADDSSLRSIEARLATSLAVYRLLLRCQADSQVLDEKAGLKQPGLPSQSAWQHEFDIIYSILQEDYRTWLLKARALFADCNADLHEEQKIKLELWHGTQRTLQCQQSLLTRSCTDLLSEEASLLMPVTYSRLNEFEVLKCTQYVTVHHCTSTYEVAAVRHGFMSEDGPQIYQSVAKQLAQFMQEILLVVTRNFASTKRSTNDTYPARMPWDLVNPFPPSHLAYWNHDRTSANLLWQRAGFANIWTDILGRSYAHIVVEAGDIQTLSHIGSLSDDEAIRCAGIDAQGRSLLAVAAMLGNQDAFTICKDRCADRRPKTARTGQSLLDLAIRAGSRTIVRKMLEEKVVDPPYIQMLETAIELGRRSIAEDLLPWIEAEAWQNSKHVEKLATLAGLHGMADLEKALLSKGSSTYCASAFCDSNIFNLLWFHREAYNGLELPQQILDSQSSFYSTLPSTHRYTNSECTYSRNPLPMSFMSHSDKTYGVRMHDVLDEANSKSPDSFDETWTMLEYNDVPASAIAQQYAVGASAQ